jgi:hypothetical protein
MKRLVFILICLWILAAGCAGPAEKIERSVTNNVFYSSSNPRTRIKIDPGFKYLGEALGTGTPRQGDTVALKGPTIKNSSYVFATVSSDQVLDKVVLISISKISTGYQLHDLFNWMQNRLESKPLEIQGEIYQCSIQPFSAVFNPNEKQLISDQGYKEARCYLVKGLCKRLTTENQPKLFVYYLEDISRKFDPIYPCENWKNLSAYTIVQKEYLKEFIQRSDRFIEILE